MIRSDQLQAAVQPPAVTRFRTDVKVGQHHRQRLVRQRRQSQRLAPVEVCGIHLAASRATFRISGHPSSKEVTHMGEVFGWARSLGGLGGFPVRHSSNQVTAFGAVKFAHGYSYNLLQPVTSTPTIGRARQTRRAAVRMPPPTIGRALGQQPGSPVAHQDLSTVNNPELLSRMYRTDVPRDRFPICRPPMQQITAMCSPRAQQPTSKPVAP